MDITSERNLKRTDKYKECTVDRHYTSAQKGEGPEFDSQDGQTLFS